MKTKDYYTVEEFARLMRVHQKTIFRWIVEGKLSYWQLGNSRIIRIPSSELDRHLYHPNQRG
jgi:excisionase family DNA binding protein